MSDEPQPILDAALALPERERLRLAEDLLQSLPPDDDQTLDDDAFAVELDRRWAEFQADPTVGIPWSQVRRRD